MPSTGYGCTRSINLSENNFGISNSRVRNHAVNVMCRKVSGVQIARSVFRTTQCIKRR